MSIRRLSLRQALQAARIAMRWSRKSNTGTVTMPEAAFRVVLDAAENCARQHGGVAKPRLRPVAPPCETCGAAYALLCRPECPERRERQVRLYCALGNECVGG